MIPNTWNRAFAQHFAKLLRPNVLYIPADIGVPPHKLLEMDNVSIMLQIRAVVASGKGEGILGGLGKYSVYWYFIELYI